MPPIKFKVEPEQDWRGQDHGVPFQRHPTNGMSTPKSVDLTTEQQAVVDRIVDWYKDRRRWSDGPMTVGGLAGTGKTTVANTLPEYLGINRSSVAFCAYTGKAASRLRGGSTIHRLIYKPAELHCRHCPRSEGDVPCHLLDPVEKKKCEGCDLQPRFHRVDTIDARLVIVDEASMVDERIYEDLMSYKVPVIWIGDHGQLPPVKGRFNLMEDPVCRLETIHRQLADSPILKLAMRARQYGKVPFGNFGPGVCKRRRDGRWPLDADLMLCGKNVTRVALNDAVRRHRGHHPDMPEEGDRVVCLKNDSEVGVFNGMQGTVISAQDDGDDECWAMTIDLDDVNRKVEVWALREQFGAEKTVPFVQKGVGLWDYGYCLTVHKAQGSEAERVVLLEQPIPPKERRRWMYTGITRAKRELEIIAR